MYLGWIRAGFVGATVVSLAFVGPSFLMVLALAALYQHYGGLWWMQGAFYGIGAGVIAILARSAFKLARLTIGRDGLLGVISLAAAIVTALTESEVVWTARSATSTARNSASTAPSATPPKPSIRRYPVRQRIRIRPWASQPRPH